ncbi:MAG: hypothetical protein PHD56_14535 [Anaerostipes sp.]|nr:hypothetical protein [Anaerostipes sp.]
MSYEFAKITGIKLDVSGTEMKIFVPDKNLVDTVMEKRIHGKH